MTAFPLRRSAAARPRRRQAGARSRGRGRRLRPRVVREEREKVGGVRDGLRARRDDAAQADPPAEREKRVGDRSRTGRGQRRGPLRSSFAGARSTPPARRDEGHAVRPEKSGPSSRARDGEALGRPAWTPHRPRRRRRGRRRRELPLLQPPRTPARRSWLTMRNAHSGTSEGRRRSGQEPSHVVVVRIDAEDANAARDDRLDRRVVARRGADDGDRIGEEKGLDAAHRAHSRDTALGSRPMRHEKRVEIRGRRRRVHARQQRRVRDVPRGVPRRVGRPRAR